MTAPKHVAMTLTNLLAHPMTKGILDRKSNLSEIIPEVVGWWSYDLLNRKPSPAHQDFDKFVSTDLDLACFLYSLAGRGAVINLPTYKSHTRAKIREDQQLISKQNRHGKLINVGANKFFFSFNITIIDENVIGEDKVGDFRTFSITGKDGAWYEGWKKIEFVPTIKENRFITENKLWTGNTIYFKNFVSPMRWTTFFGHKYIITKLLIERLEDECKFLNTEVKRLQAAGIKFPEGEGPKSFSTEYGDSVQKVFTAFETKVYVPSTKIQGDYTLFDETQENLVKAYNRRKQLLYTIVPKLRFMTRASEFSHFNNQQHFPAWLRNVKWESGFKLPRGRVEWERLKLFQDKVGEHSISILKRTYEKSATVSVD